MAKWGMYRLKITAGSSVCYVAGGTNYECTTPYEARAKEYRKWETMRAARERWTQTIFRLNSNATIEEEAI